jgi:CheY-like chemotaxis protein
MADIFTDLGYAVDAANCGETALEKPGRRQFDVSLLDLRMPGMYGLTLCRHFIRFHPRMVTMIVTAYGAGHLADDARAAGARHILPKPIDLPRLLFLVDQAVPQVS